ncbi:MAG: hypothetical protein PHF17_11635 [Arcobacteraceae bacterium]|nr:hypothetical protein [Arcobacteraceae bacterium]
MLLAVLRTEVAIETSIKIVVMELVYLWIVGYKNIKNQGFNLSVNMMKKSK